MSSTTRIYVLTGIFLTIFSIAIIGVMFYVRDMAGKSAKKQQVQANNTVSPNRTGYSELPAHFPKDLPLIKQGKITTTQEDSNQIIAVFVVPIAVEEAEQFYEKELATAGWNITSRTKAGSVSVLYLSKQGQEGIIA